MEPLDQNTILGTAEKRAIVLAEATNSASHLQGDSMARRRHQQPEPFVDGSFWILRVWDTSPAGSRKRKRIRLAPADMPLRLVKKIVEDKLKQINAGLVTQTAGVRLSVFMTEYEVAILPTLSSSTADSYRATIRKYLIPALGHLALIELSPARLQVYFSSLAKAKTNHATILKIRDCLSSIVRYAITREHLVKNPMEMVTLPKDNRPRRRKPTITPIQFHQLITNVAEPYATMAYVATMTGFRVSELLALRWGSIDATANTIRVEERFCRGDWSQPKTEASAAPISASPEVIQRLEKLKTIEISVRAGRALRHYRLVRQAEPDDLVFQAPLSGGPLNDQNILKRHLQPTAGRLGFKVTWQMLRRSYATWLVASGADPKSVQGQLRHTRISTTMDIYAQTVSSAQQQAVAKLATFVGIGAGPETVQ